MRWMGVAAAMIVMVWMIAPASAADLQWTDDNGTSASLADYRGKPLVVHFWASWCPPCRKEMPELEAWVSAHPEVNFVPVTLDVNINDAIAFLKSKGIDFPVLQGSSKEVSGLGVRGLPATVVIGAGGEVLRLEAGVIHWDDEAATGKILDALDEG